jgi:hypothetical protein
MTPVFRKSTSSLDSSFVSFSIAGLMEPRSAISAGACLLEALGGGSVLRERARANVDCCVQIVDDICERKTDPRCCTCYEVDYV